jgi:ABC transporter substrate binding protein
LGLKTVVLKAVSRAEIDKAFAAIQEKQIGALLVGSDSFFLSVRDQFVALAARAAIPTVFEQREFATAGGLMSYGTSLTDAYHQMGNYTGRILKGEKPADLPVCAVGEVRAGDQFKGCQVPGRYCPSWASERRRRGDRMRRRELVLGAATALPTSSACGT